MLKYEWVLFEEVETELQIVYGVSLWVFRGLGVKYKGEDKITKVLNKIKQLSRMQISTAAQN